MKNILYIIAIIISLGAKSQVLSYDFYSFKVNNMFNINPAYSGKDDGINIVLGAQTQNKGVAFANKNYLFGMHSKISKKQALGTKIISDTRGAFQVLKADLSYAYFAKISNDMKFTFGLSAGLLKNSLLINRIDNFQSLDQSDPTLTKSYYNTNQFAVGTGFLYNYKKLDVSFSMPHIISTNQPLNSYINTAIFYTINANEELKIIPWICYQNIPVTKNLGTIFIKGIYKDKFWLQAGYQTNQAFNATFGLNIENLCIGYGYNFNNSAFNTIANGTHEITIAFTSPKQIKLGTQNRTIPKTLGAENDNSKNGSLTNNASLSEIVTRLDKLSKQHINKRNRENIKAELELVKEQLLKAEIDNSTQEKAKEVSDQLQKIDNALKKIEDNLQDEN